MKKLLVKTASITSLLPTAFYSLYVICTRMGWEFNPLQNYTKFEVKLPAEDESLWDFLMDGLA